MILQLVSSKFLTTFSDFRCAQSDPDFLSVAQYCAYLEFYATQFNLWPHIELSSPVKKIRRRDGNGHVITFVKDDEASEWECDAVAICTGLHVNPFVPKVPGIEKVPLVMHSSDFKQRQDFGIDQQIMILGAGETAHDLSYLAVTSPTKSVTMCHRDGFFYAPKVS